MKNYELFDNTEATRYEFHIGEYLPVIEYIKTENGEIYLTHTEVPEEISGQGIGSQLAEKTLTDIDKKGLRLVPLCPFISGYIQRYPEWRFLVLRDAQN